MHHVVNLNLHTKREEIVKLIAKSVAIKPILQELLFSHRGEMIFVTVGVIKNLKNVA